VVQVRWAEQVDVVHRGDVDVVYVREPSITMGSAPPHYWTSRESSCCLPRSAREEPLGAVG